MFAIIGQLVEIFASVGREFGALSKVSALWFVLMTAALLGSGVSGASPESMTMDVGPLLWLTGSLIALFGGWYAAHRYLMAPEEGARWFPASNALRRFIAAQVKVMTGLSLAGMAVVSPLVALFSFDYVSHLDMTQSMRMPEIPWYYGALSSLIAFLLFARFLLMAPLAARAQSRPAIRSWVLTHGHWLRLCVLQAAALAPAVLGIWLATRFDTASTPPALHVGLTVLNAMSEFYSLWLFTRLAEDEYALLAPEAPVR